MLFVGHVAVLSSFRCFVHSTVYQPLPYLNLSNSGRWLPLKWPISHSYLFLTSNTRVCFSPFSSSIRFHESASEFSGDCQQAEKGSRYVLLSVQEIPVLNRYKTEKWKVLLIWDNVWYRKIFQNLEPFYYLKSGQNSLRT